MKSKIWVICLMMAVFLITSGGPVWTQEQNDTSPSDSPEMVFPEDALDLSTPEGVPDLAVPETVPEEKGVDPSNLLMSMEFDKFVLGPEDIIQISVWGNSELTAEMPIRPDGLISYPLLGDIQAKGLTPSELKQRVTTDLRNYITDASVTVIVKEINSIKISIAGEVNRPGTYNINRPLTLLHLFAMAEGFTVKADLKKSYILRNGKKLDINFFALVKQDDFAQNILLKDNDLIFIHDNFQSRINIMGEVNKPQVIDFQEGMTVLDAVLMAEGLTEIARPKGTKVYRRTEGQDGMGSNIEKINIELDKVIFQGDLSKNIRLKSSDIILIPRSFF